MVLKLMTIGAVAAIPAAILGWHAAAALRRLLRPEPWPRPFPRGCKY